MQRRTFPLILLYGFGLALALSLLFNGFLLFEQSHQRSLYGYDVGLVVPADHLWQQDYSDCKAANQQKDSLIRQLTQAPSAPPDSALIVNRTTSN